MSTGTPTPALHDPMTSVHEAIEEAVGSALEAIGAETPEITFEIPPDPKFGDLACPVCMGLARALKKNPRQIAADVKARLDATGVDWVARVEVAGGGYLNFTLDWPRFMAAVHDHVSREGDGYGFVGVGKGKKVVVEHTSANPNKPIHLGTARCAVLGDVTGRLLKMAGYDVEVENYVDDLGRQIAVLLHGYEHHKAEVERNPGDKADYYFGLVYMKGSEDVEDKPGGEEIVRDILHKMEDPSTPENKLAKEVVDQALKGQLETTWRMNIFYDVLIWERHIITSGLFAQAIETMMARSPETCYKVDAGDDKDCIVLDMSAFGEKYAQDKKPYKILVRSNGVSTYTGKDIAFQLWKFGEAAGYFSYERFIMQPNGKLLYSTVVDEGKGKKAKKAPKLSFGNADRVINVIGNEQKFPQEVVKSAMKVLGFDDHYENSQHLSFKEVGLPDQKFSGRKGTWVGFHADAAIDKATEKALAIIKEQNPTMPPSEQEAIAATIGVGAIKFYLAKFDMEKEITIIWDDLLNFEGDACPYVQYSCVRAQSILNKAKEAGVALPDASSALLARDVDSPEARALYFSLAHLPRKVVAWAASLEINQIPLYALEVADKFNKFYHECPILRSDVPEPVQRARILLVQDTITVFKQILRQLMGIDIPLRM